MPQFADCTPCYKRHVDDGFLIWFGYEDSSVPDPAFERFKQTLNASSNLTWKVSELSNQLNFLDLALCIDDENELSHWPHMKPMNLLQCLPPQSRHPPGILYGIIVGILSRCWMHSSNIQRCNKVTSEFYCHLIDHGHELPKLQELFHKAALHLHDKLLSRRNDIKFFLSNDGNLHDKHTTALHVIEKATFRETLFFH